MIALSLAAAAAASASVPPIISTGPGGERTPHILVLRPGEVRCAGEAVRPVRVEQPSPVEVSVQPGRVPENLSVRLNFRIDATGRPLSIAQSGEEHFITRQATDLVPAFSVWAFSPGAARDDCQVSFAADVTPAASAPMEELYRALVQAPSSRQLRRIMDDRVERSGSTCFNPAPAVRLRAYPAFKEIPQPPGTASYSLVGFDINAAGRPVNVRIAQSWGNEELDRQSLEAVRKSRFAPEAKQGCTYPYWRRSTEDVPAPPVPELDAYRQPGATCSREGAKWANLPRLVFPPEFVRRGVEGWAILRYDVAPWGETGNIEVVAAEPAARFGRQAETILRGAKAEPSSTGATGCVDRVIFRVPAPGEREEGAETND